MTYFIIDISRYFRLRCKPTIATSLFYLLRDFGNLFRISLKICRNDIHWSIFLDMIMAKLT